MIEVFKSNRRAAILIASAIGVLLLASALSACQIEDLIKIDVPDGVATAIDTEPSISVSDSSAAWEDWQASASPAASPTRSTEVKRSQASSAR